jgi:hypothetical protein
MRACLAAARLVLDDEPLLVTGLRERLRERCPAGCATWARALASTMALPGTMRCPTLAALPAGARIADPRETPIAGSTGARRDIESIGLLRAEPA